MRELYKRKIDNACISNATYVSKSQADSIIVRARLILDDPDRSKRLDACECPVCWKIGRVGGAKCTTVVCGMCDAELKFSSTCVDAVCVPCAKKIGICKRCCADLDLKQRKYLWFAPEDTTKQEET